LGKFRKGTIGFWWRIDEALQIIVSWPASYAGYTLEATDDLGTGNWNPVTLTGVNTAALDAGGPQLFFRLLLTWAFARAARFSPGLTLRAFSPPSLRTTYRTSARPSTKFATKFPTKARQ
jgi:hypothetical protein